jgi:hypothetical protein
MDTTIFIKKFIDRLLGLKFGIYAVLVDEKDEQAKSFYEYFNFKPYTNQPLSLYLLSKYNRAIICRNFNNRKSQN